jgi:hypothetical protein
MKKTVSITTQGIRRILRKYKTPQAFSEYIWNGFDAGARTVSISYSCNVFGSVERLTIADDGRGIPLDNLDVKFGPLMESEKAVRAPKENSHSLVHGRNGVGRLTFFTFAQRAVWHTRFKSGGRVFSYEIEITTTDLQNYDDAAPDDLGCDAETGTSVEFFGFGELSEAQLQGEVIPHLVKEFCWFLRLNVAHPFRILINEEDLPIQNLIADEDVIELRHPESGSQFRVRYIQWQALLNKEYSKYYFLGSDGGERYKENTTLNNKGDGFHHSVYVQSACFDSFRFELPSSPGQPLLQGGQRSDEQFKFIMEKLAEFLHDKRRPFLRGHADKLVAEYEEQDVIPAFGSNPWDQYRRNELEDTIRGLYEVQPRLFVQLNLEQKKTFVNLLNLVLDSDERDRFFDVLKEVVGLNPSEMTRFAGILQTTGLSRILRTIHMLQERYLVVSRLKQLVHDRDVKANEPDHVQKLVENHYWLFGEQYHLVTAAEPSFEEALRRYVHILHGEDAEERRMDHEDRRKEMDLFLCRQRFRQNEIDNVVVELKNPKVKLGEKELSQVKKYMRVILAQDEFNASNMSWTFFLVGNRFDTSGYIEGELESHKNLGERYLVHKQGEYKIYVLKWSDVFAEFECRHNFLNKKLEFEREKLLGEKKMADEIVAEASTSTAALSTDWREAVGVFQEQPSTG